VGRATSEGW